MGLFAGIETAVPGSGGVYFLEGFYRIELIKVFTYLSFKKKVLFIAECKIIDSSVAARPPGMTVSWTADMGQPSTLGNIKAFAWAVSGDKTTPIGEAEIEYMVAQPANPLAGQLLDLEAVTIITKEKKQPFTRHDWSPVGGFPPGQ